MFNFLAILDPQLEQTSRLTMAGHRQSGSFPGAMAKLDNSFLHRTEPQGGALGVNMVEYVLGGGSPNMAAKNMNRPGMNPYVSTTKIYYTPLKTGSCQFLVKECAQVLVNHLETKFAQ